MTKTTAPRSDRDTIGVMSRWGLAAILFVGCAQLAGIDNTSKGSDAGTPVSTLQLEHVSVGKTIIKSPHAIAGLNASYLVPDAAAAGGQRKVVPTVTGTDTWTADTGGIAVPIQFKTDELPTPNLRILDFPTASLRWPIAILEHPNAEPAPGGSTIDINVGLPSLQAGETYQLFTIGAWSNVGLAAPADGTGTLAPGALSLLQTNSPIRRLDKITTADSVLLLRYAANTLTGHLIAPPFVQTSAANPITGNMVTTGLDRTLDIRVNQNAAAQRLATVRPAVGAASYVWRVNAAPGLDYSIQAGPQLDAAGVLAPVAADPQTITATYGNPFSASFDAILVWDIRANRTYTNASTLTTTLSAGFTERAKPSPALALTTPAGLPDRITANAALLNVDNVMVPAPLDAPIDVSFVTDAATKNSLYALQLFELVPTMMTTYTLTLVVTAHTANPGTKLPRDLFKAGSLYVLRAFSFAGCYPAAATGDLAQQSLPCAFSFADSGVFQVVQP
jgi:hypothetical protein